MMTSLRSSKRGFTLIELLVVIAIIGILSAVVLASLSTARTKARDAKRISDINNVQLALELYYDSRQGYPQASTTNRIPQTLVDLGYLPKVPTPPGSGTEYVYYGVTSAAISTTDSNTSYALAALLERTDNQVLSSDADQVVGVFDGDGAGTDCASSAAADQCYDIRP